MFDFLSEMPELAEGFILGWVLFGVVYIFFLSGD